MSQDRPRYLSYLIRMWQVKAKQGWQWRASLESPGSGERRSFPSLDRLIVFLKAQMDHQGLDGKEEKIDILGAAWTWWALRSESLIKGFAPQATGR